MNAQGKLGRQGERIAARFLEELGYQIRERNYRCALGEIDLIATSGEYLVFVEVKARTAGQNIHPSASVTPRKQAKVRQVGEHYRAHHPQYAQQPRFDVVSVEVAGKEEKVEHLVNAF
ncbi:MAG: YraN family protein [SAR324 cluster bacterium]|nr:YraN family protein [SAR324 cluster bacterium]